MSGGSRLTWFNQVLDDGCFAAKMKIESNTISSLNAQTLSLRHDSLRENLCARKVMRVWVGTLLARHSGANHTKFYVQLQL
jgi:hypothetical protein